MTSEEKFMIAKKKSRKGPKTALISRSTRDSEGARPPIGSVVSVAPAVAELGFTPFAAEDVDAVARSSVALADGVQAFGQALIQMQRRSVSAGLLAARGLVDARNLQDVMELQRRFVTGSLENAVRETGALVQLASRVATEAWAPRVAAAPGRSNRP